MKKSLFAIALLLTGILGSYAEDYKIVDRSAKKRPDWIGVSGNGYIAVSSQKPTLDEARKECMNILMVDIINAVAVNVCSQTSSDIMQITSDDDLHFTEEFRSSSATQSAVMPFLSNISISKAKATYWEKHMDKKTQRITYVFSMLYPLSDAELERYRQQFHEIDQAMVEKTRQLEQKAKQIMSIEDIDYGSTEIKQCVAYFFDQTRRRWAESIAELYLKAPSKISLHGKQVDDDSYRVWLEYDGRKITPSGTPVMKSDCADNLNFSRDGNDYVITFSTLNCLEDEETKLEVSFRVKGKVLKRTFTIE